MIPTSPSSNAPGRGGRERFPSLNPTNRAASPSKIELQQANDELREKNKELQEQIANLRLDLSLAKAQARKYRQQGAATKPQKADSKEETLFNVCNHPRMNAYFDMEDPRVITQNGLRLLDSSKLREIVAKSKEETGVEIETGVGASLDLSDITRALREGGKDVLSLDMSLDVLFPKNTLLVRLGNDVSDGDKNIAVEHLECFVTMSQFCVAEDGRSTEQNGPCIGPDGSTASRYAFESAARHRGGNACLYQAGHANSFRVSDVTPNKVIEKISKSFNETWALPSQQIRRRETFDPTRDYEGRRDAHLAEAEMNMQGFGKHKTQMCLIIDKPSFDRQNERDVDNATRVARKLAQLSAKLDDNGTLEVFSHEPGVPTELKISRPGEDIKIEQSMQRKEKAPSPEEHIFALLQHFYPDDPTNPKYRQKPVFCTLVTKSLTPEKYELLKNTTNLFSEMKLPFFLKIVNVNPNLSQEEIERMDKLDNKKLNDSGAKVIDSVDVVQARDPGEITPKNFLREYAGFVAEARKEGFLLGDQGFDTSKVDIRSEGRRVA